MNIKYTLGAILTIPLLPVLYYQAKKVKASVPTLPEAKDPHGMVNVNSFQSIKLLTIGESTIAGVGADNHSEAFSGTLAMELAPRLKANIEWKVYAKSGYTVKRINDQIVDKITESEVDLLVIGIGANDAFQLNNPSRWRKNVKELITNLQLKFQGTPILFINMPPIKEFPAFTSLIKFTIGNLVNILGEELKSLVSEYENIFYHSTLITYDNFIDRFEPEATIDDFFSDGIHPSKLAYQAWAKEVASFILKDKKIKKRMLNKKHLYRLTP